MSDALDRVIARAKVQAHTAAAPPPPGAPPAPPANPPAQPVTPDPVDVGQQITDLNDAVSELAARVGDLEQGRIDDAVSELDGWTEPGMAAALPEPASA